MLKQCMYSFGTPLVVIFNRRKKGTQNTNDYPQNGGPDMSGGTLVLTRAMIGFLEPINSLINACLLKLTSALLAFGFSE